MENLVTMVSSFLSLDLLPLSNPLQKVSDRYTPVHLIQWIVTVSICSLLFFLQIILSRLPSLPISIAHHRLKRFDSEGESEIAKKGDSSIARALSQMLSIVNETPVCSRKYETVRGLAERVMDENLKEESGEVNRTVLSAAFSRAMGKLESAMWGREKEAREGAGLGWVVWRIQGVVWRIQGVAASRSSGHCSAEKLAAELLWMARMMVDCGAGHEAVSRWGSSSNLASMSLAAEPPLQGSLVKLSVYLFKQGREMEDDESGKERGMKLKMLMSWLPVLCQASNGTDAPVLSSREKAEMEAVLEEMIEKLSNQEQEKVLALWLHHFTSCPNSDWPNLQTCYARWYAKSRKLSLLK